MRNLKVALAAACAVVVGWAFTASADIPASAYVQDGLLAQWDGIENAGRGQPHNADAAYPQELVSGLEQTLTGTMAAGDDYFTLGSGYLSFKIPAMIAALNVGDATVEIRVSRNTSAALVPNGGFVALGDATRGFWLWQNATYPVATCSYHSKVSGETSAINYNGTGANTVTFLLGTATENSSYWANGVKKGGVTRHTTNCSETDNCFIGTIANQWAGIKPNAKMYSLRLYNRKLSEAEIVVNSNIDKIRFEGADPATLTWPDGYRWNSGSQKIECRTTLGVSDGGKVSVDGGAATSAFERWTASGSASVSVEAVPATGRRFVCWRGDVEGLDATSATLTVDANRARSLTAVFVYAIPASIYVQDGLVAQWDGIENAGVGQHETAPTSWANLKNAASPMTLTGDYDWSNGVGVYFNRTSQTGFGTFVAPATPGATGRTVETAACLNDGRTNGRFFGENYLPCLYLNGQRFAIWANGGMDGPVCERTVFDPIGHFSTYGIAVDTATKETVGYFDGAYYTATKTTCTMTYATALTSYLANRSGKDRASSGAFYALRIYNRVLTDDEVAFNTAVDAVRFNGADPAGVQWPEGYRWNAADGRLERHLTIPAAAGLAYRVNGAAETVASVDCWLPLDAEATVAVEGAGRDDFAAYVEWEGLPDIVTPGARGWTVAATPDLLVGIRPVVRQVRFVDYLASHTLEYVDTGLPFVANRRFTCDWANDCFRYTGENKGYGAGGANASDISGGGRIANSAIQPYILNGNRATTPAYTYSTLAVGDRFRDTVTVGATAQLVMTRLESDTTYTSAAATTPANYTSVANINLFRDGYSTAPHPGAKRIYRATLVDTTTEETLFDLFPCVVDGEGAFYDRISARFLRNRTAGRLTPGPTRHWRFTGDGKVLAGFVVRAGDVAAGTVTVTLADGEAQTGAAVTNFIDETTLPVTATVVATPNDGAAFLRWGGAPHGKVSDVFAAEATLTVDRAMQVSAGFRRDGVNSAKAYAGSGLVALWDGLENQGAGEHDDAATDWVDATGHGYVFEGKAGALSTGAAAPTYSGQYWNFSGSANETLSFMMPDGNVLLGQNSDMTVEIFAEADLPTANKYFGFVYGWTATNSCADATRTFGVYLNNNQKFLAHFSGGGYDTAITRYAQEYVDSDIRNASVSTLRHDGLQTFRYAPGGREYYTTRVDASRPLARIDLGYNTYGWYKGNLPMRVYAVRVYDRAITSEESALNHALDKMRYMGYAAEDAGLPPNYDVDGEFNVSLRHDVAAGAGGSVSPAGESWVAAGEALTVTATADAGNRFVRWEGDVEGLSDVTGASLTLPGDRPRRVTAVFAPTAPDETSYVQDGLLLQLDGIRNTRGGPNPGAGAWEDLAAGDGTTRDFVLNGNAAFSGNSLSVAQGQREAAYFDGSVFDCGTVEVLMRPAKPLADYSSWQVFNFGANRQLIVYRQYGFLSFRNSGYHNAAAAPAAERVGALRAAAVTYVDNVPTDYYLEGAPSREIDPSTLSFDCGSASSKPSLAGRYNADERQFAGEIYAIRVYSRRLTAAEIARNHAIDLARFVETMSVSCLGDGSTAVSVNGAAASQSVRVPAAPGAEMRLVATVPEGTRSVAWTGLPEDAVVSSDGKTATFVVPEGGVPAISLKATFLSPEHYVQGGASAIYDAIENAGKGVHSASAAKWANLVDPANAMEVRGTSHKWLYGAFVSSKGDNTPATRTALLSEKEFFLSPVRGVTLEFAGRVETKHDHSPLFCPMPYQQEYAMRHTAAGAVGTYWRNASGGTRTVASGDFTWSSAMIGGTGGTYHNYIHGQQCNTGASTYSQFHHSRMFMMSRPLVDDTASYTDGRVYSARRYERKLTAGEIAVNAAVDAARYGIRGALGDWQLVKGEPRSFGTPSPAVGATPLRLADVGQARTYSVGELDDVTGGRGFEQNGTRAVYAGYVLETPAGRTEGAEGSFEIAALPAGDVVVTWKWTVSHQVGFTDEGKDEAVTWTADGATVTLTSQAGEGRICRWTGLPDDAVLSDDTKTATFVVRGPVACSVRTVATVPQDASDYLRYGLLAQYDALENAGIGAFDSATNVWTDLAGKGGDIPVTNVQGGLWRDNALYFAGAHAPSCGTGLSLTTPKKISAAQWTVELVLRTPGLSFSYAWAMQGSASNYSYWRAFFEANANGWRQTVNNNTVNTANSTYKLDQDIKVVSRYDGAKHYLSTYTNGVLWVAVSGTIANGQLSSQLGFLQGFGTDARLYTARVYERCLTDEEVGYNTALDQVRFFDARGEIDLPEGFRFGDDGHVQVRVSIAAADGCEVSIDGESWSADGIEGWFRQDADVTLRARVGDGMSVGRWAGLPGYAKVSDDGTTVTFKAGEPLVTEAHGHEPTTVYWRGTAGDLASDAANWVNADGQPARPCNGDTVVLDQGAADMTWDIDNIALRDWNQTAGYSGTVTFKTGRADDVRTVGNLSADGERREFIVLNDVTIEGGTWTHLAQPSISTSSPASQEGTGIFRLIAHVGRNFNLATNSEFGVCGTIDLTAKGFQQSQSPGNASHGGQGTGYWGGAGNKVYGKVKRVRTIGSSSSGGAGGGNLELHVAGEAAISGHIRANGGPDHTGNGSSRSGGGVWITAGSIFGSGDIIVRAEKPGGGGGAGGGRISVMLTTPGATFDSFTGRMSAHDRSGRYNAGTIYTETADQNGVGDLLIRGIGQTGDGNWWATSSGRSSHTLLLQTDDPEDLHFHNVTLTNGVQAAIGTNTTVIVDGEVIGDPRKDRAQYTFLCMRGGTLKLTNQEIFSNIYFRVYTDSPDSKLVMGDGTGTFYVDGSTGNYFDRDLTIEGNLHVLKGGRIQQAAPLSSQTVDSGFRCNLSVTGDVTIDEGGSINVTGEGTPNGYGFWGKFSEEFPNGGGFHGGNAPGDGGAETYGSIFSPTNLGSGGKTYYGGGAIRVFANGDIVNNGMIMANGGGAAANVGTGAGGSVWLRAARLLGTGDIEARGGDSTAASDKNPGAGGRIALELTDPTAAFADYEGTVTARGGAHTNKTLKSYVDYSGAGTVLYRTAADTAPDAGLLVVDNGANAVWATTCPTMISGAVTDHTVRNVKVANGAWLSVARGETLTVTGDLDNRSANLSPIGEAADATTAGGTITFADAARESRVTGTNVFTSLSVTTPGKTVKFGTAADLSLASIAEKGQITVTGGGEDDKVHLRSVEDGVLWPFQLQKGASAAIKYADVKDSDARSGLLVVADDTNEDLRNNKNWAFLRIRPGDPIVWQGLVSDDWTDPYNWDPTRAPVDTDVVTIRAGTAYAPALPGSVALNRLVVETGATLDLAGYDLTVTNGLDVAGALIAADSKITFAVATNQTVRLNGTKAREVAVLGGVTFEDVFSADAFSAAVVDTPFDIAFAAGAEYRFASFLVSGILDEAPAIGLGSTVAGERWSVNVSAKGQVMGVTVSDSAATGITLAAEVPSDNGGNNDNWLFGVKRNIWTGAGDAKAWTNALNWSRGVAPDEETSVVFEGAATVTMPKGEAAVARTLEVAAGEVVLNATDATSKLQVGATFELSGGTLVLNVPAEVDGAAFIRGGATLTHSIMGDTRNKVTAWNRVDLTVNGDLTVEQGGEINTVRKGYNKNIGESQRARVHGGRLSTLNSLPGVSAPTNGAWSAYGSIFHPVTGGESYDNWSGQPGGGVIRLQVAGTLTVNGTVTSGGYYNVGGSGTAGGSVWITAGALAGAGLITAEGGKYDYAGGSASAGGRVAVYLTTAAGTNAYTGTVTAKGGSYGTAGSLPTRPCGTVYWQFADEEDYAGTIVLDNAKGSTSVAYTDEDGKKWTRVAIGATDIPAGEAGDDPKLFKNVKIVLRNYARVFFTADLQIRDIVVEDMSDVFVNGHDVEVLGLEHKKRKGWSKDAFVFNPERSNEIPPKLGRLHWRLPGLRIIVR